MRLIDRLVAIWRGPETIQKVRGELMANSDELVARFDAALNELASDLSDLRDDVAEVDSAVAAKFEPLIARAEAMGRDPENPVPDAPSEPSVPGDEPQPGDTV